MINLSTVSDYFRTTSIEADLSIDTLKALTSRPSWKNGDVPNNHGSE